MRPRPFLTSTCLAALLIASAAPASAAEFTDLADAADDFDDLIESTFDPFDFSIEPTLRFDEGSATITREAACVPDESDLVGEASNDFRGTPRLEVNRRRCTEPTTVFNRELDYEESTTTLDVALRAGIYKDLELRLNIPYVLSDSRSVGFAEGVGPENSTVDPAQECPAGQSYCVQGQAQRVFSDAGGRQGAIERLDFFSTYRFFEVGDGQEYTRSGFADPSIGLHWAPFNDERDDTKATLLLGIDYTMPIAPIKARGNDNVGRGLHELHFKLASSKRFDWIEPYFGLEYFLPLAASDSLIKEYDKTNEGQIFTSAPQKGQITVGTEFIPHEDPTTGARYAIDLRFTFGYTSEGRDYTPLFDFMTGSDCNGLTLEEILPTYSAEGELTNIGRVECAWIARQPSNSDTEPAYDLAMLPEGDDTAFFSDGIQTVESYGTYSGLIGFYIQPVKYFQLKAQAALTHQQEHFLTNARTGRDKDDANDTVDLEGEQAAIERNPAYNPSLDSVSNRFRIQEYNTWSFFITTAFQF